MNTVSDLRPELEALPERMQHLRVHRQYPVPWFVADGPDGEPEFRAMDGRKWVRAVRDKLCWVCGQSLGGYRRGQQHPVYTFVAGPMCGVNRTSAEPPCHLECARWSARNCPFLSRPHMTRREQEALCELAGPEGAPAGDAILRNPGVVLLWTTRTYKVFDDGKGGRLLEMGEPTATEWWAEGRPATRAEIEASLLSGLPALEEIAALEPGAPAELRRRVEQLRRLLPAG